MYDTRTQIVFAAESEQSLRVNSAENRLQRVRSRLR